MQRDGLHAGEAGVQRAAYRLRRLLDVEMPKQRPFTCARSSVRVESQVFSIVTSQALSQGLSVGISRDAPTDHSS